jgi:hypothetical protein
MTMPAAITAFPPAPELSEQTPRAGVVAQNKESFVPRVCVWAVTDGLDEPKNMTKKPDQSNIASVRPYHHHHRRQ